MTVPADAIPRLVEAARWAPSGDNTQPWRFAIAAKDHLVVHGSDTRAHCVYDLDGHASQVSIGALLETLNVVASGLTLRLQISRRQDSPESAPVFDVRLSPAPGIQPDPLLPAVPTRTVQRRPMRTRPLSVNEVRTLESCLPAGYAIRWFSGWGGRWQMARLMFANAKLRLTMREAFEVHRAIIDWDQQFSEDKIPDQALGADRLTLKLMRWAMADWRRVQRLNMYLAGTWAPRLQMDLAPSMLCSAHAVLLRAQAPSGLDDYVEAGRAVQRLWLTACHLGLQHQPEITPLVFSRYVRERRPFTESPAAMQLAERLSRQTQALLGADLPHAVWIGRLGESPTAQSRSLRLPLAKLLGQGDVRS